MLVYLLLGEVVFGGLGTGVFSIVIAALVGIFLGGLMVGRTPEYLGKKVTSAETRWIALYILLTPMVTLLLTAIAVVTTAGRAGLVTNTGPHGFTEILFAYASCMANNGLAMAGLNFNSVFYNVTATIAMLAGRYGLAALALALADGSQPSPACRPRQGRCPAIRRPLARWFSAQSCWSERCASFLSLRRVRS